MKNTKTLTELPALWCIKDCKEVSAWASEIFGCCNEVGSNHLHIDQAEFPDRSCYYFRTFTDQDYTEISLDDFKRLVLGEKPDAFKLPKSWAIKITKENQEVLRQWVESQPEFSKGYLNMNSHMKVGYHVISKPFDESYQLWVEVLASHENQYKEITTEQFMEHVLKTPVVKETKSDFKLPAKWQVQVTGDNIDVLETYLKSIPNFNSESWGVLNPKHWVLSDRYDGSYQHWNEDQGHPEHTKITFEQFQKYVLGEESFKLPEKWCIKSGDLSVVEYCNKHGVHSAYSSEECVNSYCHFPPHNRCCTRHSIAQGYTEITFEQFQKYVLKQEEQPVMEKKIIGYILKNKEMYRAASMIAFKNDGGSNIWDQNKPDDRDFVITPLREAGVLDLWFEPVYEESRFKVGDWIYYEGYSHEAGPYKLAKVNDSKGGGGFIDTNGDWRHTDCGKYRLATDKEIENHLIEEARKRDIVPGVTLDKTGINTQFSGFEFKPIVRYKYYRTGDILDSLDNQGHGQGHVYEKGEWAEIVKAPKIEIQGYEAKIESGQVRFGCQTYSNEFIRDLVKCLENSGLNMTYKDEIIELSKHLKD